MDNETPQRKPTHLSNFDCNANGRGGADIICSFKSLTSRMCKSKHCVEHIFQLSFYDHIILDKDDYDTRVKYIHKNPKRWYYDNFYDDKG